MLKILNEFYPLSKSCIVSESASNGTMKLKGLFQRAETPNRNQRIYKKTLLEREVGKLIPLINEHRLLGELDHPDRLNVKYSDASHRVTGLKMEGNDVWGEIELLNTPKGQIAQTLIKDGVTLGISSRGGGTLTELKEETNGAKWEVNDDFSLVTFDLVPDESTIGATLDLFESKCYGDKCKQVYNKSLNEKIFIQLLKSKLNEHRK
jgi:hypothetical protein